MWPGFCVSGEVGKPHEEVMASCVGGQLRGGAFLRFILRSPLFDTEFSGHHHRIADRKGPKNIFGQTTKRRHRVPGGIAVFPFLGLAVEEAFGCGESKFDDDHTRIGDDPAWCRGHIATDSYLGFHLPILSLKKYPKVFEYMFSQRDRNTAQLGSAVKCG